MYDEFRLVPFFTCNTAWYIELPDGSIGTIHEYNGDYHVEIGNIDRYGLTRMSEVSKLIRDYMRENNVSRCFACDHPLTDAKCENCAVNG